MKKTEIGAYRKGRKYLIRTVTFYYVGRLVAIHDGELILTESSWIPDTGRYGECLAKGDFSEVEKIPDEVIVSRGAIVDAVEWAFDLPQKSKP